MPLAVHVSGPLLVMHFASQVRRVGGEQLDLLDEKPGNELEPSEVGNISIASIHRDGFMFGRPVLDAGGVNAGKPGKLVVLGHPVAGNNQGDNLAVLVKALYLRAVFNAVASELDGLGKHASDAVHQFLVSRLLVLGNKEGLLVGVLRKEVEARFDVEGVLGHPMGLVGSVDEREGCVLGLLLAAIDRARQAGVIVNNGGVEVVEDLPQREARRRLAIKVASRLTQVAA